MLKFRTKVVGDAVVLKIAGPLQGGGDAETLRRLIDRLILSGVRRLVLDCGEVERIDAAGVGALVYARGRISRVRGHFALLNPTSRIRRVLAVSRLSGLFTMAGSEAEALVSGGLKQGDGGRKTVLVEYESPPSEAVVTCRD